MDQPHNQFLYKEIVHSHVVNYPGGQGPTCHGGKIIKINLYSTGNIDLFHKDVLWCDNQWGPTSTQQQPDALIRLFYSTPKVLTFNGNTQSHPIMHNLNDYLDQITFVPTEHLGSFHFSETPIKYDILEFIEYILNRNQGRVEEKDFDIIRYSLHKETDNMELYDQTLYLNKLIVFLLNLLGLLVLLVGIFWIIFGVYTVYKTIYCEHFHI